MRENTLFLITISTLSSLLAEVSDGEKERDLCRPPAHFLLCMLWHFLNNGDIIVTCDTTYSLRAKKVRALHAEFFEMRQDDNWSLIRAFKGETNKTTGPVEKRSL